MHNFLPRFSLRRAFIYLALFAAMALLNFALPQREPLGFALYYAGLVNGLNPFLLAGGYLLSSLASLSLAATLAFAIQAAALTVVFALYLRLKKKPKWERALYCAVAELPLLFLFPHTGYPLLPLSPLGWKGLICVLLFLVSQLADGALYALLNRAFRCRLTSGEVMEIALVWVFTGLGILGALGKIAFLFFTVLALLFLVILFKSATAVLFAAVLSLPLCLSDFSLVPLAEAVIASAIALLFTPYRRAAPALAGACALLVIACFHGVTSLPPLKIALAVGAIALPAALLVCLPEGVWKRAKSGLLFYREKSLPRVAINRNRRAVGEQLYEVSALFREIETAFSEKEAPDRSGERLREKLLNALCVSCQNRRKCESAKLYDSIDKLIAIGLAKGRVNLIDLPAELSAACCNCAGLLFALNKHLAEYRRYAAEMQSAREGRKLLAEQAHGVSEILRKIALEQSEEFCFSDEEATVAAALATAGFISSEIFLYGEEESFTVSVTLESAATGKELSQIVGEALGVPLSLAEKIPLTSGRACFVLKRKANYDAAFGVASRPKEGKSANGDAHSILRIDERQFLVALSDGMGSGEEARSVSDLTLSLFESFYKAKMPSETVLSAVNKLITYSSEETFSCLDLASVNLDTGATDIVKIGSPVGFLLSGEELKILEGESLPIGMLEAVHPATLRVVMKENDFLIFMSDGVTSAFGSESDLCEYLSALRPLNPQSLAEDILKNAVKRYGERADDDMTVLTVKLTKSA